MSIPKSTYSAPAKIDKKNTVTPTKSSGLKGSDKTANSAIQGCPLKKGTDKKNTEKPCDVETITISDGKRSVTAIQPRHRRKASTSPAKLPKDKVTLMSSYDVILEVLAPVRLEATDQKAGLPLQITESHHGTCADSKHPCVSADPSGLGPQDTEKPASIVLGCLAPYKVWGKALEKDATKSGSLLDLWPFGPQAVKDVNVTTQSCAVRLSSSVKSNYNGLVRVYREEEWSLSISIPTLVKAKHSYASERGGDRTTEGTLEVAGVTVKQDKVTRDKGGIKSIEKTYVNKDGQIVEAEKKRDQRMTVNLVDVEINAVTTKTIKTNVYGVPETTREVTPSISLKRNGKEFSFTKLLNDLLNLSKAVKDALNAVKEIVPKVGFSMDLDVGVCEGSISGNWGYRPDASLDSAEYKWVMPYFDLQLQIVFLRIDFSLMFGIDVKSPNALLVEEGWIYALTLKVQLELGFAVETSVTVHLTGAEDPDKEEKKPFKGEGTAVFKGVGQITLMGKSLKAEAGTKITVTSTGNVKWGLNAGFYLDWSLARSGWIIYATAKGTTGNEHRYENEIWEPAPNWRSGTLFK